MPVMSRAHQTEYLAVQLWKHPGAFPGGKARNAIDIPGPRNEMNMNSTLVVSEELHVDGSTPCR